MKKILLAALISLFIFNTLDAQRSKSTVKWFSLAAKAGIGNSIFLNSDHIADPNVTLSYFSLSNSFGGRFTFTYGDNLGFGTDLLLSTYNQNYSIDNGGIIYDKDLKIKATELLPFFRYTGYNTAYIELGGKFSTINSVSETNSIQESFNPSDNLAVNYETKFTSAVLGFGLAVFKTERIDINLGARIAYSFTDLCPNYDITNDGFYLPPNPNTKQTNPLSVQAIFEVNYFFAFWGDAKCGRGRFMLFK